ncbi:MAG: 4'-phosphopantetheinyl transferase superfamily protein [Ruminococcus sp.]
MFRFYKIWTQKEAYYKMLRIGLTGTATQCNSLNQIYLNYFIPGRKTIICIVFVGKNVSQNAP